MSFINAPASSSDPPSSRVLLPVPTLSTDGSEASFTLSEVEVDGSLFCILLESISAADLSISSDGSFVETSSGPTARALKRLYDERYGIGVSRRSPYAISGVINQYGSAMYRVGKRGETRVMAVAAVERVSQPRTPPPPYSSP
ncbi:hypothetical protein DFH09DRAFT_1321548 [Mycena vulgaris]|nr:hypothetical protein DFH09DRAFT_1321548 [Mycena vulgaris]